MTEEVAKDVNNQESVVPEANLEDQGQEQVTQSNQDVSDPAKGDKEYNWRQMEKKNEELSNQVRELARREEERSRPQPPKEDEELENLAPDDILTVEQSDRRNAKRTKKLINEALKQREVASLPEKTRGKFNDFDSIMTEINIKKLETQEPGLAQACANAPNPWEATYKILKKFVVPEQESKAVKSEEKLNENLSKPISSNSVGRQGPLSNANTWSEASQSDLYNEMMQAARRS